MTMSASLHKRKALSCVVILIIISLFTADILDLREELCVVSCPYSSYLDDNITTGITSNVTFEMEPFPFLCSIYRKSAVKISFLHLLPYGLRAPPSWS
jgi:hypothetical protein